MSPEQACADHATPKSDIYSLGAILYSIITLQRPFTEENYRKVLQQTIKGDFTKPSELKLNWEIDAGLEAICLKAMALKSRDRYKNVSALAEDLRKWNSGYAPLALNAPPLHLTKLFIKRNKIGLTLSSFFLVLIAVLTLYSYTNLQKSEEAAKNSAETAKHNAETAAQALEKLEITQKKSKENFRKLMNSRIKIQQTINKLNKVSEEKVTIAQIAADQFIDDANGQLSVANFAKAQIFAEQARSLAPEYRSVILLLGKIKLLQYNLVEAQNYFTLINKSTYKKLNPKFISQGNVKEIVRFIKIAQKDNDLDKTRRIIYLSLNHLKLSTSSKINILKHTLLEDEDSLTSESFSTARSNFPISALSILPLKYVQFTTHMKYLNKSVNHLQNVETIELHNQLHVPFRHLTLLKSIKTLKLVNCQVNSFIWASKKSDTSLEHIILLDTPLADYSELLKINDLKRLTLSNNAPIKRKGDAIKQLKEKGVKIQFISNSELR